MLNRYFISVLYIVFFSSCSRNLVRVNEVLQVRNQGKAPCIFIEMPKNNKFFEHVAPIFYEKITHHFESLGYSLVDKKRQAFRLSIIIRGLAPEYKLVSPDVLLFHTSINAIFDCALYDGYDTLIGQETFSLSKVFSKSRNPVTSGNFFAYDLNELLERIVYKIELKFRSYLLKKE